MMEPSQASTASAHACATLYSGSGVASARTTAEGFAVAIIFAALRRRGEAAGQIAALRERFAHRRILVRNDDDRS